MSDCELSSTCPFFNDSTEDTAGIFGDYRDNYCRGNAFWCKRYLTYKASEIEAKQAKALVRGDPVHLVRLWSGEEPLDRW